MSITPVATSPMATTPVATNPMATTPVSVFCKGSGTVVLSRGVPSDGDTVATGPPRGQCHLEEELNVLGGRAVPWWGMGAAPHHVVDGLHDLQHLLGAAEWSGDPCPPSAHSHLPSPPVTSLLMWPSLLRS